MSNVSKDTIKLISGVRLAVDAIKPTYGPFGVNSCIEVEEYPYHVVANDAQTIVQAINTQDSIEKRGLGFMKELMDKAEASSGDGRKTTSIILDKILDEAKDVKGNMITFKKELDALIPFVESEIDIRTTKINESEVEAVATIASESLKIGKTLGKIYEKIGKDGIIHLESSGTYEDSVKYIEGVRFQDCGFLSPFMVHDEEATKEGRKESRAVYENPTILVTKRKIAHINDINPLLETLTAHNKKDLVIFTDDMDSGVASLLVKAHQEKIFNVVIIKAPILWKNYVFEDFAKVTGSTIVEDASGINFKNLAVAHLGTCGKLIVDKDETVVMGIHDISDHIEDLKNENSNDSLLRLSWLQTKTAILKLGANNESELSYLRLKTSDAINSSRLALKGGVVKGAGICLSEVAEKLPTTEAGSILKKALLAPKNQMIENGAIIDETTTVVDAAIVVKNAVRNAVALASTILTIGVIITIPPKTEEELALLAIQNKRPF